MQQRKKKEAKPRGIKCNLLALDSLPTAPDSLFTVREAASLLRASLDLVRSEIKAGRLPATRIGKRPFRISRAKLIKYGGG